MIHNDLFNLKNAFILCYSNEGVGYKNQEFWIIILIIFLLLNKVAPAFVEYESLLYNCDEKRLEIEKNVCYITLDRSKFKAEGINDTIISDDKYYTDDVIFHSIHEPVTEVKCHSCDIPFVPIGIFSFEQLETVDLSNSQIQELRENDVNGLKLVTLNMSDNRIAKLVNNIFFGAQNLKVIDLSHNEINQIDKSAFDGIIELKVLLLSYNQIKMETCHFENLKNLHTLNLDFNQITKLNFVDLQLTNMTELVLSNNNISNLQSIWFNNLINMDQVETLNNPLEILINSSSSHGIKIHYSQQLFDFILFDKMIFVYSIAVDLINQCVHLAVEVHGAVNVKLSNHRLEKVGLWCYLCDSIDLSINKIKSLTLYDGMKLKHLNLSRNHMETIKNLTTLNELTVLDLSFNYFKDITANSFMNMTKLKRLYLRSSGLRTISFDTFSQQLSLRLLDISYNNLKVIDLNALKSLINLDKLFIDGNNLVNLDSDRIRSTLPRLQLIGISDNFWNCTILNGIMRTLQTSVTAINVDKRRLIKPGSGSVDGVNCIESHGNFAVSVDNRELNVLFIIGFVAIGIVIALALCTILVYLYKMKCKKCKNVATDPKVDIELDVVRQG